MLPDTLDQKPLLILTFAAPGNSPPSQPELCGSSTMLSAGDAHFSFIVSYTWPSSPPEIETYYNNLWSIRTDSRSFNDSTWIPLDEELSSLEDPTFVKIEKPTSSGISILCAQNDEPVEFIACASAGWMTAAICNQRKAWIFPFGRAITTIPNLPTGIIPEFNDVKDIRVGSSHIVVLLGNEEVWTFGLNDHGQCGFSGTEGIGSWRKLDIPITGGTITQLICGRWNTYLVVWRKVTE